MNTKKQSLPPPSPKKKKKKKTEKKEKKWNMFVVIKGSQVLRLLCSRIYSRGFDDEIPSIRVSNYVSNIHRKLGDAIVELATLQKKETCFFSLFLFFSFLFSSFFVFRTKIGFSLSLFLSLFVSKTMQRLRYTSTIILRVLSQFN